MNVDWSIVEERLYHLSVAALRQFAAAHPAEAVYGFAFDCQAEWGEVALCLNTETALASWIASSGRCFSQQEAEEQLRWRLDLWNYHRLNLQSWEEEDRWDEAWWPIQDRVQEQVLTEEEHPEGPLAPSQTAARFLKALGRVLLRLEADHAFDALRRTDGFRVFLRNDSEAVSQSWQRLSELRQQGRPPADT
jgi:hypothetical protein